MLMAPPPGSVPSLRPRLPTLTLPLFTTPPSTTGLRNGKRYAVKCVDQGMSRRKLEHVYTEINILKKLHHPCITRLVTVVEVRWCGGAVVRLCDCAIVRLLSCYARREGPRRVACTERPVYLSANGLPYSTPPPHHTVPITACCLCLKHRLPAQVKMELRMVMELMEGGDLFSYIVQKDKLPEQEASVAVWRVASALSYVG